MKKTGKWLEAIPGYYEKNKVFLGIYCSECGSETMHFRPEVYCPDCGAYMENYEELLKIDKEWFEKTNKFYDDLIRMHEEFKKRYDIQRN